MTTYEVIATSQVDKPDRCQDRCPLVPELILLYVADLFSSD